MGCARFRARLCVHIRLALGNKTQTATTWPPGPCPAGVSTVSSRDAWDTACGPTVLPSGRALNPRASGAQTLLARTGPWDTHCARCTHHSVTLLWARMTEVSMSIGWYRMPRSSMASSSAPTTYRASWRSAGAGNVCESPHHAAAS